MENLKINIPDGYKIGTIDNCLSSDKDIGIPDLQDPKIIITIQLKRINTIESHAVRWFINLSKEVQWYLKCKYNNGRNPPDNYDVVEIYKKENNLSDNCTCI